MLRVRPLPVAQSVPPPGFSPSPSSCSSPSSSSATWRHGRRSSRHVLAAGASGGFASFSISARPNPHHDARGRRCLRQSRVWDCSCSSLCCCKASLGGGDGGSEQQPGWRDPKEDDGFLQASLLVSETIRHYNLRKQGFFEEAEWHSSGQMLPLSVQASGSKSDVKSIGHGFLRRFQNPTIFLKIACDGDLLLPIVAGEFAVQRLLDSLRDGKDEELENQFKFNNLVRELGYEVKMVRITKRIINTYYARIFLGKPAENVTVSVDSRPSDAINVAIQCQAPIYVSRDIVLKDAIHIVYGTWRGNSVKTVYDVSLDSATEGQDLVAEELDLIGKMNAAVGDERYTDAALWRDKLAKLRTDGHDV